MPKLPRIPSALVMKALRVGGFFVHHHTGSHAQLKHHSKTFLRITVPMGKQDISPKTLKAIIKQAGLTVEEFLKFL